MTDHTDEIAALRARVQRLEDREEIHELIARYGRAVDDRDWDALRAQYTPDAIFDSAVGRSVGVDAIIDYYEERTSAYVASYHYPHSSEIVFETDDHATGVVCAHAELTIEGDTIMVALRYQDDYRRIDGRWRFYERNTNLLYVLKLTDLPAAFADRMRIRWPGSDRTEAEVGADVSGGRTMEPRGV